MDKIYGRLSRINLMLNIMIMINVMV
jgi:hypothetical protein